MITFIHDHVWTLILIAWVIGVVYVLAVAIGRRLRSSGGDYLIMTRRIAEHGTTLRREEEVDRDFADQMVLRSPREFRIVRRWWRSIP